MWEESRVTLGGGVVQSTDCYCPFKFLLCDPSGFLKELLSNTMSVVHTGTLKDHFSFALELYPVCETLPSGVMNVFMI